MILLFGRSRRQSRIVVKKSNLHLRKLILLNLLNCDWRNNIAIKLRIYNFILFLIKTINFVTRELCVVNKESNTRCLSHTVAQK